MFVCVYSGMVQMAYDITSGVHALVVKNVYVWIASGLAAM